MCAHDTYNLSTPFPLVLQHNPHTQLSSCRFALSQRKTHLLFYARAAMYKHIYAHGSTFTRNVSSSIHELPGLALTHTAQTKALFAALRGHRHQMSHQAKSRFFKTPVQTCSPHAHPQERCGSQHPRPDVFDTQTGSTSVPARVSFKNSIRRI